LHYLLFDSSRPPRDLHSFPTRRSSDLLRAGLLRLLGEGLEQALQRIETCCAAGAEASLFDGFDDRAVRGVRQMRAAAGALLGERSEEHTSELQSRENLVCRLLLEKKKK